MANNMKQTAWARAIQQFFQTTTLHGFKYLCSKYYADRIGWLICCCASTCCAGVLCAVLWARFIEIPALLTVRDLRSQQNVVEMPLVAVCPPAETVADLFQQKLLNMSKTTIFHVERNKNLDIAVQCSDQQTLEGCEFFTKFNGEEWITPISLSPNYNYIAQITFTSVVDSDPEKLVDLTCSNTDGYSKDQCMLQCQERLCGCSDPLRIKKRNEYNVLAPCLITQLNCLRDFSFENLTCKCLPSCKKVSTLLSLQSSPMNAIEYSFDEIYAGINPNKTTVLHISVGISGSRSFLVNPTDTWITLLSSLGGVFNMFLGFGLFSALEVLFLIFVRLPIAIRRSTEMESPSAVTN
ncbi:uncharacterized protein LOC123670462 [Melitaea cinxia]|uniref:uncharacterized protein LOC123670462 n=1 Tax=Melitaea cinxia TaxID=113334 RepID=UPI001E272040|nr:uncharacterized protein LOC123670462 [Melitaea cinxia]